MMQTPSILVLGCTGMLGHKLLELISQTTSFHVIGTVRSTDANRLSRIKRNGQTKIVSGIHAGDIEGIERLLAEHKPIAAINCIGIVKQLPEGSQPIPSIKINSLFPHLVAAACRTHGVQFYHFSTDCVFSGRKGNYGDADVSDAEDLYGRSKFLGEVGDAGAFTVRSSIIGAELGSALGLFEWFLSQKGKTVKGFKNALYTGFTTTAMAKIILNLIQEQPKLSGVWTVASQPISKFDLLHLINDELKLGITINEDTSHAINRSLNGERFNKATGFKAPSWPEMITELCREDEVQRRFPLEGYRLSGDNKTANNRNKHQQNYASAS